MWELTGRSSTHTANAWTAIMIGSAWICTSQTQLTLFVFSNSGCMYQLNSSAVRRCYMTNCTALNRWTDNFITRSCWWFLKVLLTLTGWKMLVLFYHIVPFCTWLVSISCKSLCQVITIVIIIIIIIIIETLGHLADEAQHFLTEIGRRATHCTADPREAAFLYQRISVAIQRFNAVCLANSLTISESPS